MSIVLDTNVLSELLRPRPDGSVVAWFERQPVTTLFVSAITCSEMLLGVRLLPAGKRRNALEAAVTTLLAEDFAQRILPFDGHAVHAYVEIVAHRRAVGRPISQFDAQIAAIAQAHGFALATRNVSDFEGCDVEFVNPWMLQ